MNGILTAEFDIFCLVFIGYIYMRERSDESNSMIQKYHKNLLILSIAFTVSDMLFLLMLHENIKASIPFWYLVNIVYYLAPLATSMLWTVMVESMRTTENNNFKRINLIMIPGIIAALVILSTPFTKLVFYPVNGMEFARGPLNFVFFVAAYGYFLYTETLLFNMRTKDSDVTFNKNRVNMMWFPIPLAAFAAIQVFLPEIPITTIGYTLSIIFYFTERRTKLVSVDQLTLLNNRAYIIYYLDEFLHKNKEGYCLMIDIDRFKSTNDIYGHVVGDTLLMRFGSVLKEKAEKHKLVAARYAGDEFLVVGKANSDSEILDFWKDFEDGISDLCVPGTDIKVTASMGFTKIEPTNESVSEVICCADSEMYLNKVAKKKSIAEQRG